MTTQTKYVDSAPLPKRKRNEYIVVSISENSATTSLSQPNDSYTIMVEYRKRSTSEVVYAIQIADIILDDAKTVILKHKQTP